MLLILPRTVSVSSSNFLGQGQNVHEEEVFDSSKVVNFKVPHNAAVQIYDFKSKKSRVQFGPELVSEYDNVNPHCLCH